MWRIHDVRHGKEVISVVNKSTACSDEMQNASAVYVSMLVVQSGLEGWNARVVIQRYQ